MAAALSAFLEEASALEHQWGSHDCCLFPANWIARITGVDPAAPWRGLYSTEEGAEALIREAGGLIRLFGRAARSVPVRRSRTPGAGAVGILRAEGPGGVMGGICVAPGFWSTIDPAGGVMGSRCEAVAAWEILSDV